MNNRPLSRAALKYIAVVAMLIDHIGYTLVWSEYIWNKYYNMRPLSFLPFMNTVDGAHMTYTLCRRIGRIAFPIFAYFVTEGFLKTRDVKKYVMRMALFALAAEIPYNLCFGRMFFTFEHNNVIFTHLLGLLMLVCLKRFAEPYAETGNPSMNNMMSALIIAGFCIIAQPFDGGVRGILMIACCYVFRSSENMKLVGMALANMVIVIPFGPLQLWALAGILLLKLYNGQRGRYPRYFFYLFYTLHLLALFFVQGYFFPA